MHKKKITLSLGVIVIIAVLSSIFLPACSNKQSSLTENDVGEIVFYRTEMEHVATDSDGFMYVDNEILIVANADASYSDIENLAKGIDAEIVGWIEQTGDYQLKLNQTCTADQLSELIDSLNDSQLIDCAYINFASQIDGNNVEKRNGFYFGDEWEDDLQNFNNCMGDSWGIEAIEVLAAWDILDMYKRNVNPIKVGLIDSAFDTGHEDLGFAKTFYNVDSGQDHGTHVAGTMAARTDNREGICGVYPYGNGNLYGVSYSGICNFSENGNPITTSMFLKIAYAELILRDVKVINSSLGFNYYQWPLSYGDPEWDEQVAFIESNAYVLGDFLDRLLDKGYDFVLVNAAGNDSDRTNGIIYDSKYNFWTTVISEEEYPDVYNRIIVVGAINSDYEICNFSNGGDRVDIFAPGDTIYSTTPNNNYANKNWSGTSMAAPHVSGVAAMVWSVNNELTGAQVKEIVCSSHSFRCTSCNMVDAYVAMRKATHTDDTTDSVAPENGAILCWVVSADDNDIKIQNANVTVLDTQTGEEFSTTTDSMGHFEIFVPAGTYSLVVKAEGYEDYVWPSDDDPYDKPISVENESVNYLTDWIKMKPIAEGKQLTQVNCFRDNDTSNQYNLTYNENGLLATCTTDYYSSTGNNHYEYRYTYNENGQLVQYQNVDNVYPERKNYYSEDGILISWSYWEYDTFEYIRHCEYDGQGRLTREYADDGTYNTVYSYNEAGLVSSKTNSTIYGDMKGSSENTYLYDDSGRLIEETITSDWGFGEETSTLKYTYDYSPFVLVESYYDGSYSSSDLRYEDVSILSIYLDETAEFEMTNGYLSKVECADCVYEFFYDGAFDASFNEHIPDVKYEDEITGTYLAKYEDVQISIDADNSSEYFLTYTASGVTLEKIPLAYFNSNTSTEKMLMFILDDYYPQYSGYVEVCWMKDSLFPYSYNALIDGLDDTDGNYSDLTKTGVFIPAN